MVHYRHRISLSGLTALQLQTTRIICSAIDILVARRNAIRFAGSHLAGFRTEHAHLYQQFVSPITIITLNKYSNFAKQHSECSIKK